MDCVPGRVISADASPPELLAEATRPAGFIRKPLQNFPNQDDRRMRLRHLCLQAQELAEGAALALDGHEAFGSDDHAR
jgi:hypothetical protein